MLRACLTLSFVIGCANAVPATWDPSTGGGNGSNGATTGGGTTGGVNAGTNGGLNAGTNGGLNAGTNGGATTGGATTGNTNGGATTGGPTTNDPNCDPAKGDLAGCGCDQEGATRSCYTGPSASRKVGACHDGMQTCTIMNEFLVWSGCSGDVTPGAEVCSTSNDNNCNGLVGCADPACTGIAGCCAPGTSRSCYDGPGGTAGVGVCASGTQNCDNTGAWLACTMETLPSSEAGHCTDGLDNDCNGLVDCKDPACANDIACKPPICSANTTRACYDGPTGTNGVGQCHGGTNTCAADGQSWSGTCAGEVVPGGESGNCHDGVDNDCNGLVDCKDPACNGDPGCACTPNTTRSCYTGPVGTEGVGICKAGSQTCNASGSAWGPCIGSVVPSVEAGACTDGLDNDCNGKTDCADSACTFAPNCCVPTTTYDETLYATSATSLYIVHSDYSETQVGTYGTTDRMTDIAITPGGDLYTISSTSLYWIDIPTGAAYFVMTVPGSLNNALTFLPDNRLLAADASGNLKVIDPVNGTVTAIGKYGSGYGSAGDLVAVGDGTMFGVSATNAAGATITNNLLMTINTSTGAATPVGPTGFNNVFGLAYYKSKVVAFTTVSSTSGQILEIDPATGAGTLKATHSHQYFGGTVSPLVPINGCM